ncbi:T-box transcription factor TBX6-like [Anthonomus grandis grandis]|uniref:T-box transcription factor TBX6-like n=1 Tax=Anthonomus grandis grandis TaxID=2921223 RepID=UPI00216525C5|nr:T-box transcription factor TBX6-like [Anthonomus grandis grandis]
MEVPMGFNNYEGAYLPNKCKVTLKNKQLWNQFHNLETEMIITKSGRRMFPSLQIQISNLEPHSLYCVFLEMVPASRCRYKYSSSGGWAPAGSEEAQSPHRLYLHPEGPAKGEYWMSQPVSFGRLKLTNMPAPPAGQIVLSSMHKYQPRIIIAKTSDPRTLAWAPSSSVVFPETQFIAVTAYQNEKITQLKIDNNPFAKGFRQNGQAKCKRKRICVEEDKEEEEPICVTDDDMERINGSSNSISDLDVGSPRSRSASESDKASVCSSPLSRQGSPTVKCAKTNDMTDVASGRSLNSTSVAPSLSSPSFCPYPMVPNNPYYPYFSFPYGYGSGYSYPLPEYYQRGAVPPYYYGFTRMEAKPSRRFTDFSIKSILGC